jgi:hypothetical protein
VVAYSVAFMAADGVRSDRLAGVECGGMDDPNNVRGEFLLNVLGSYVGSCLFAAVSLFAAWLSPPVLRALRWLRARQRSRNVTIALTSLQTKVTEGILGASVSPPDPPPGTPAAGAMATMSQVPPSLTPLFANGHWARWDAANDPAARIVAASKMRGSVGLFNATLYNDPRLARPRTILSDWRPDFTSSPGSVAPPAVGGMGLD